VGLKSDIISLGSGITVTTTGNGTVTADVSAYEALAVLINTTAASGTTPTFLPFLQFSPDGGTTWFGTATGPVFAAANITAAGQTYIGAGTNYIGGLVRLGYTIGGTTPSFTYTAYLMARR
jgi:hypothetical protein